MEISKIKAFLERYPRLNKLVRAIYIPLATKFIAFRKYLRRNRLDKWWSKEGDSLGEGYWDSIGHPHRSFLVERIAAFSPISSVLEIGCASGPNLYLLAKRFPESEIMGIDIRPHAVQDGNEGFAREGITNVKLSVGRAEDLSQFKDKSVDVVFTDAILIYVRRAAILRVIKQMLRIPRKRTALVECHDFERQLGDRQGLGVFNRGLWIRDYMTLLKQFVPEEQIRVTKITKEVWPDDGWGKNGAVIEVTIAKEGSI